MMAVIALLVCTVTMSAPAADKQRPEPKDSNEWFAQCLDLGDTGYMAVVGPWGSKNPVDYSVAVEKKNPDGSSSTCFEAKLKVAKLPKGFAKKPIGDVVKFNPRTTGNMVTFDLGDQQIRHHVPAR